jgi:FKBP-type peptidyl-prolyl cis-trans isomerase SlpA
MEEGSHQTFNLPPERAFGQRNKELVRDVSRATLDENSAPGADYRVGDLVDFAAPGGGRFAGILRELRDDGATFDFNHPLAGQALTFEVKLISPPPPPTRSCWPSRAAFAPAWTVPSKLSSAPCSNSAPLSMCATKSCITPM